MTSNDKKYRDDLILALRLHEVPGPRIGEVLAEIESHVTETGEDPRDAFGDPKGYADRIAGALDGREGTAERRSIASYLLSGVGWRQLPALLATGVSGWLLGEGAHRLGAADAGLFGLHPLLMVVLGATGMASGVGWMAVRYPGDRVVDPRTGDDVQGSLRGVVALMVALPAVQAVGIYLLATILR